MLVCVWCVACDVWQAVNPKVTLPYWDFTYDAEQYGDMAWNKSDIFNDDWFGPVMQSWPYIIDSGRWASTPIVTDFDLKENNTFHNAYGIVTNTGNNNPSLYLQRTNVFCGLTSTLHYSQCKQLTDCMKRDNLTDWDLCLERQVRTDYPFTSMVCMASVPVDPLSFPWLTPSLTPSPTPPSPLSLILTLG